MSRNAIDLTTGSITRKLLRFSIPLMLNYLINLLYGIADKAMLGRYVGDAAMAAASVTNHPYNMVYNLFVGISLSVLITCGNYLGANDKTRLRCCMHTSVVTGLGLGLAVLAVGMPLSRWLLIATGTPRNLLPDALLYFRIRFAGCPLTMLNAFVSNILTSHGDTKRSTLLGICSGLLNVILNYIFLLVIKMGVAGVAVATVLSSAANLTCKLIILFSPKDQYHLRLRELRPDLKLMKRLLLLGIPNGLNNIVFSFSNVLLQASVNSFGTVVIAGNSVADSIAGIASIGYNGIPAATITAVSQCRGAGDYDRMRQVVRKSLLLCHVVVDSMCVLCMIFSRPLSSLYTTSSAVVDAGSFKMWFYLGGYFIHDFGQIYVAALKGLGESSKSFIANVLSICIPRVLWVTFIVPLMSTPAMLYAIYPISWLISAILLGIAYHRSYQKQLLSSKLATNA